VHRRRVAVLLAVFAQSPIGMAARIQRPHPSMNHEVVRVRADDQVFRTIVLLVSVDVMHDHARREFSPENRFSNKNMNQITSTADVVAVLIDMSALYRVG
jgi:hypothetical protein